MAGKKRRPRPESRPERSRPRPDAPTPTGSTPARDQPSADSFIRIVSSIFPCRGRHPQVLPEKDDLYKRILGLSGNYLKTFLLKTMLKKHYGVQTFDDYMDVNIDDKILKNSKKRSVLTARLNAWFARDPARRRPLSTKDSDDQRDRTAHVGTYSAAVIDNLDIYLTDYVHLMIRRGHLDPEKMYIDGELPIFLHIDGKREGYTGTRGEVFPILVHFPTARFPGAHVAWLPIGFIVGSASAASWKRLFAEGLGVRLAQLKGMRLTIRGESRALRARYLGDYASIRVLTNTTHSNIPFPCRAQDHKNGLGAEWFRACPCAYCTGTAFEMYESMRPFDPCVLQSLIPGWDADDFIYGPMHAMMHYAGGFVGDVARLCDQLEPKSEAAEHLVSLFVHPRIPQSRFTYDPLYKYSVRTSSRTKAWPSAYETVFESDVVWEKTMRLLETVTSNPAHQAATSAQGLDLTRIPPAMNMLRAQYYMWRDPRSVKSLSALSKAVDMVWLRIVRVMMPPTPDVYPGPTYCAPGSGRGISSHIAIEHVPEQRVRLGRLASASEKGGENMNSFCADFHNRYHVSKISNTVTIPSILLRYAFMLIFARAATSRANGQTPEVKNVVYDKITGKPMAIRRRWRGPKVRRVWPSYLGYGVIRHVSKKTK